MAVRVRARIQPQQASYRQMRDPKEIEPSIHLRPNLVRHADSYVENGITHLTVGIGGPDYDLSPLWELIAWRDEYRELGEYLRMIDWRRLSPNNSPLATETELLDLYLRG